MLIQMLFFCLIPLGIYSGIFAYRLGKKIFASSTITCLSFNVKEVLFKIEHTGYYSLWLEGKLFAKTPINQFKPQIVNTQNNSVIHLSPSFMRPHINGFKMSRMELFKCHLLEGDYKLELVEGASKLLPFENALASIIRGNDPVSTEGFSFLLKPSVHFVFMLLFILLIMFSIGCTVAGLVLGLLADQIFS